LEPDWSPASDQRTVSYRFLPPGEYEFQVQVGNGEGEWNPALATVQLTVPPHFWQTWWFKLAAPTLISGLVGGTIIWNLRRRQRLQLQRMAQAQVLAQERARIARDIHDDLGASLTRISLLSHSAQGNPAQTANYLNRIADTALNLTRAMDEIVWAVNPRHDRLDSMVNYIGKFAQDLLSAGDLAFRLEVPPQLPAWPLRSQVRHNLFLAVKEALHNALKHAAASEVRVVLAIEPRQFTLAVVDNGCGFVPGTPAPTAGSAGATPKGGNGLWNMKTRLEEIGGQCVVTSQAGAGTTVTFAIPLPSAGE